MKLLKKVLSLAAVLALVVTAVPANARAAADVVDFEDGNFSGFSIIVPTENADADADVSLLSVTDLNGSKALFVDTQDAGKTPKVFIDVVNLVGVDNLEAVRTLEFDFTIVNPSGEVAGWNGGSFGASIGADGKQWYDPDDWTIEEYENATVTKKMIETFVDGMGFTNGAEASKYIFMKWAGGNDFYIDNVRFLDADGNAIEFVTTAAEAVEEAAPAAADVPKTGVVGLGLVYGLGALATGAFALRRKQK